VIVHQSEWGEGQKKRRKKSDQTNTLRILGPPNPGRRMVPGKGESSANEKKNHQRRENDPVFPQQLPDEPANDLV
jgi:hypothetical protein